MKIYKYILLVVLIIQSAHLCQSSDTELDSNQLLEWHMSQAPELANIYNNYQNTGRMVGKCLISVVYEKEDNTLEISHKFVPSVFISGWDVKDTKIELKPKTSIKQPRF